MKIEKELWKVTKVEHDSWSGPKVIDVSTYDDRDEAIEIAEAVNSRNTLDHVPDYYITAEVEKVA